MCYLPECLCRSATAFRLFLCDLTRPQLHLHGLSGRGWEGEDRPTSLRYSLQGQEPEGPQRTEDQTMLRSATHCLSLHPPPPQGCGRCRKSSPSMPWLGPSSPFIRHHRTSLQSSGCYCLEVSGCLFPLFCFSMLFFIFPLNWTCFECNVKNECDN